MSLHFNRAGKGPSVFLLHGLFGSWENLNAIAKALQTDFDVISVDLPNHGRSAHVDSMSYLQMANDVLQLADELGIKTFHLVGHSMGGKVAMELALTSNDRVERLIALDIAPVAYHARHNVIFDALASVPLDKIQKRADADAILAEQIETLGTRQFLLKSLAKDDDGAFFWRFNLSGLKQCYESIITHPCAECTYSGPTLFIKGGNSDYLLPEHRNDIQSRFPNSKARVINGAGHWLHAEKPDAVNKAIRDFLLT